MKKALLLVAIATLVWSTMFALEGLQIGAGFSYDDFDADPAGTAMGMDFDVFYGTEIGEEMEFEATLGFHIDPFNNGSADEDMEMGVSLELEFRYNLELSEASTLTFGLNSWTLIPMSDGFMMTDVSTPDKENKQTFQTWLTPKVAFTQTFGFGDMFFNLDFPIFLASGAEDQKVLGVTTWEAPAAFDYVNMDFTMSLFYERYDRGLVTEVPDGFGAEIALETFLANPDEDADAVQALTITPYFGKDFWYAELEIGVPLYTDGMKEEGMSITPKGVFDMPFLPNLSAWLAIPINGLGADDVPDPTPSNPTATKSAMTFGIGLGINYTF